MKKKIIIFFAVLLAIAGILAIIPKKEKKNETQIATVEKRDMSQNVEASGTVNPVHSINIGSQVSGRIYKIYADYNSKVTKGQVLAEIDPSLFQASVDKARAD